MNYKTPLIIAAVIFSSGASASNFNVEAYRAQLNNQPAMRIQYKGDKSAISVKSIKVNRGNCNTLIEYAYKLPIVLKYGQDMSFGITCLHPILVTIETDQGVEDYPLEEEEVYPMPLIDKCNMGRCK